MNIKQGEIYWINFSPAVGSELKGKHPGIILQSTDINTTKIATTVVAGITSNMKLKKIPGNVFLKSSETGLPKDSIVNITQIHTIDKKRIGKKIGLCKSIHIQQIFMGIDILFDK